VRSSAGRGVVRPAFAGEDIECVDVTGPVTEHSRVPGDDGRLRVGTAIQPMMTYAPPYGDYQRKV